MISFLWIFSVDFQIRSGLKPKLTGNFLNDDIYQFEKLHFHWGSHDYIGSEHAINGLKFPLEVN